MIRLDTINRKLQVVLGAPATTTEVSVSVSYSDKTTASYAGGMQASASTGLTAADVCNAPGASTTRDVDYLSAKNKDTVSATVTVLYNDNGTTHPLFSATLGVDDQLTYVHGSGWQVLNASGQLLTSGATGATGATGPQGRMGMAGLDGNDGDDGMRGAPGPVGPAGATGPQGPMSVSILPGEDGEDGITIPGQQGGGDAFNLKIVYNNEDLTVPDNIQITGHNEITFTGTGSLILVGTGSLGII